jgi:hypothetical protein
MTALPVERHDLRIRAAVIGRQGGVLEVCGTVHRSTVDALAAVASGLRASLVVVDLSGIALANYWLLSALAKAHVVLVARKGAMRLVVGGDDVFTLVHTSGFDRVAPTSFSREYEDRLAARLTPRRDRVGDRQRVIDRASGGGHGHRNVRVLTTRPARWPVHGPAAS